MIYIVHVFVSDSQDYWSDDGCEVVATGSDVTVCECMHLTNFAVLMSPIKQVEYAFWTRKIKYLISVTIPKF